MTHPTSADMTFDTSLIDISNNINTSFSTTASDSSETDKTVPSTPTPSSQEPPKQNKTSLSHMPPPPKPIHHLPTKQTYNAWAPVYDTDGNILQAIDDHELETLLPEFLDKAVASCMSDEPITVLDLGCGTGRNTVKLVTYDWPKERNVRIIGVDFSSAMLEVAEGKLAKLPRSKNVTYELHCCDPFSPTTTTTISPSLPPIKARIDILISTLVLEHIPLATYFSTISTLLKPGGWCLVTNMHEEMGAVSSAGFVSGGTKVRGESWVYGVAETVEQMGENGVVVGSVRERGVKTEDLGGVVGERGVKWVGVMVWFGVLGRKGVGERGA